MMFRTAGTPATVFLLSLVIASFARAEGAKELKIMQTPSGIRFGMIGAKGPAPAPTLFNFATMIEPTLTSQDYCRVASLLAERGYVCVSLDLPCHPGAGLEGWAQEIGKGNALIPGFVSKVSEVLDYLVKEGYSDPERVAVSGTSRGGFIAMHVAAADPRVKCAVGFWPVTDLADLTEFAELKDATLVRSLALVNLADKLAGRSVWVNIGNNDQRVNTDSAIAFTRKVVAATLAKRDPASTEPVDVELHVTRWPGHGVGPGAHDDAAAWIMARNGPKPPAK